MLTVDHDDPNYKDQMKYRETHLDEYGYVAPTPATLAELEEQVLLLTANLAKLKGTKPVK